MQFRHSPSVQNEDELSALKNDLSQIMLNLAIDENELDTMFKRIYAINLHRSSLNDEEKQLVRQSITSFVGNYRATNHSEWNLNHSQKKFIIDTFTKWFYWNVNHQDIPFFYVPLCSIFTVLNCTADEFSSRCNNFLEKISLEGLSEEDQISVLSKKIRSKVKNDCQHYTLITPCVLEKKCFVPLM